MLQRNLLIGAAAFLLAAAMPAAAEEVAVTACDWEAAHPSDPDRVGPGVGSRDVDTERAIRACEAAVAAHPEVARFHYQLGRALVYAADRQESDWHVGLPHLERAADMRHTQAMFVLGLMYQRDGRVCDAEPWTRAAAEAGLKSARIGYVNEYLAGRLNDCPPRASLESMAGWLNGAEGQVSGWYENMLLDLLQRLLDNAVRAGDS
jgi:hypothetical protein